MRGPLTFCPIRVGPRASLWASFSRTDSVEISSPEVVDFGALEIGRTRTLVVSMLNEGTANLTISDLALIAADGTSFELGAIPALPGPGAAAPGVV